MAKRPDQLIDLLVGVVVSVLVVASTAALAVAEQGASPEWLSWALLTVGCAALFFRRRFPRSVCALTCVTSVAYYPASSVDGPLMLTFLVGLYTLASLGGGVTASAFVIAAVLVMFGSQVAFDFAHISPGELFLIAGWFVAAVAIGSVVARHRAFQRESELVLAEERRRSAAEERLRIARDLHDSIGHHLSVIRVQTAAALRTYKKEPSAATIGEALEVVAGTSRDAITELRETVGLLRESRGLDLSVLVERARASGLAVDLTSEGTDDLSAASAIAVFRIVQESLTNVMRHSSATVIRVQISAGDTVRVAVRDNGHAGIPVPGNGITGMTERAKNLGGTLSAGPVDGGFAVEASWPAEVVR